jgi:hypothetical protein
MRPFAPIVRWWSFRMILPSILPSIVRSSLPVSSPRISIDCPMLTICRSERLSRSCAIGLEEGDVTGLAPVEGPVRSGESGFCHKDMVTSVLCEGGRPGDLPASIPRPGSFFRGSGRPTGGAAPDQG